MTTAHFFSDEENECHDSGPTVRSDGFTIRRDRLYDHEGNELAQFAVNSWVVSTPGGDEVYDNITIRSPARSNRMKTTTRHPCHAAARHYLDCGWSPLALCPCDHEGVTDSHRRNCHAPGKVPLGTWLRLQKHRPTHQELDDSWAVTPRANVGVVTGAVSGRLVGIDVDGDVGGVLSHFGLVPGETMNFRTGGSGHRFLYYVPDDMPMPGSRVFSCKFGRLEVLSEGRQTVMPPSLHLSGVRYRWDRGCSKLAALPKSVYDVGKIQSKSSKSTLGGTIGEGVRNLTLFKTGTAMRRWGSSEFEIEETLRRMNQRCLPPLDEEEVEQIAKQAARYNPNTNRSP